MVQIDGEAPELMGFYVNKFIEAETFEIAKMLALDEVRNDEYLNNLIVDDRASNPILYVDKAYDHDIRPKHLKVELGDQPEDIYWHFFPMSEESNEEN